MRPRALRYLAVLLSVGLLITTAGLCGAVEPVSAETTETTLVAPTPAAAAQAETALVDSTVDEAAMEPAGVLTIHTDCPGIEISQMLFGVFFEDINYAADGGIYAELVRNRSFEFLRWLDGWVRLDGQEDGTISLETLNPLNENNKRYAKLSSDGSGKELGLANLGYGGIAIVKDAYYDFTVYARSEDGFDGQLVVNIEGSRGDALGKVYGQATIDGLTDQWQKFSAQIKADSTDAYARLVVRVDGSGDVCLDMISLFPRDTWMGRENGFRPDLVEMLAELKPAFIRFPGGCIVEGNSIINAYRWKDTIGDVAARKSNSNLWGYYQSYGLGFYEYFLLCEDLGAEPVPIINAGLSCQVRGAEYVPMSELDEWVQDALDLIEYANGPVDSKWGSVRAACGHPEPFNLKYLGIGNENWGPEYHRRYEVFHQAVKERYPEIQLIAGPGTAYEGSDYLSDKAWAERVGVDVFDEHMYCPPQWFFNNADRYDDYSRNEMKIFTGEYAAHGENKRNNLEAALAEAAFMTGLVRNSDLVHMSAYAPLFNKVGSSQWTPDLIWFDNTRVYGTPSYYVQKMFSTNLGDRILPHTYEASELGPQVQPISGRTGLGSWQTRVEFDWVKVTSGGATLLYDGFGDAEVDGGTAAGNEMGAGEAAGTQWAPLRGRWERSEGLLKQLITDDNCRILTGDPTWANYTIEVRARKLSGAEGFLIPFGVKDSNNYYWWNLGGWGNTVTAIEKAVGGQKMVIGDRVNLRIETGRWYDIKVELEGRTIRCYLDGELIHEVVDQDDSTTLYLVCSSDLETGDVIVKAVNRSNRPQIVDVRLDGERRLTGKGTAEVLTSGDLRDENSFAQPNKVAPILVELDGLGSGSGDAVRSEAGDWPCGDRGSSFIYTFQPYSVTVLRIGQQ
jgi:alpha-L-arabinofuranosidase